MSAEQHTVINTLGQPIHVTITKTSKGSYNWEVSVHGKDIDETLRLTKQQVVRIDDYTGLNPGMRSLERLLANGQLAVRVLRGDTTEPVFIQPTER